jgi:hypothetical protein
MRRDVRQSAATRREFSRRPEAGTSTKEFGKRSDRSSSHNNRSHRCRDLTMQIAWPDSSGMSSVSGGWHSEYTRYYHEPRHADGCLKKA